MDPVPAVAATASEALKGEEDAAEGLDDSSFAPRRCDDAAAAMRIRAQPVLPSVTVVRVGPVTPRGEAENGRQKEERSCPALQRAATFR